MQVGYVDHQVAKSSSTTYAFKINACNLRYKGQFVLDNVRSTFQPVRLAGGGWLVMVRSERKVLLAGC
jgi:hypothetical protein